MKDLLTKLEAATEAEQERLIVEALDLAYSRDWIIAKIHAKAWRWVRSGAYLSAAVVLVPEGWWWAAWTDEGEEAAACCDRRSPRETIRAECVSKPALALTIAALKAHEHKGTSHDYQQG